MDVEKLAELLASLVGGRLGELIMYLRLIELERERPLNFTVPASLDGSAIEVILRPMAVE